MSSNKLQCLCLALSLVLLVAAVVIALNRGGSVAQRLLVEPQEPPAAQRTYALLTGIPQRGAVLGYRKAPVTLQFFGDLQCVMSRQVMLGALPFLIRRLVRPGTLQIRFRSRETDTNQAGGWLEFREQQGAALAAGAQGRLWNFIGVFYREQGPEFSEYADEAFLKRVAGKSALDLERWESDRQLSEEWVAQIETDEALARAKQLESTPSFLIGPTGGTAQPLRHFGLHEARAFEEAVEGLL